MNYNQLREEWSQEDAALRLMEKKFHYDEGFIATKMRADLQGVSPAERAEYIEIVAAAKGIVPLSARKEIYQALRWSRSTGSYGFLTPNEIKLFTRIFTESQENQFKSVGRDKVADKLKELKQEGMSLHNRKQYLMDSANEVFPVHEKGDTLLKRALERQEAEKKSRRHGGRKKKSAISER